MAEKIFLAPCISCELLSSCVGNSVKTWFVITEWVEQYNAVLSTSLSSYHLFYSSFSVDRGVSIYFYKLTGITKR